MRAYDDRYGFRDELDRPAPDEEKIARLDQDLSELALAFRHEKDSQKDDYYSVQNGLTTLIRLLMIDDLRKITVEPSNTDVDIRKLRQAIDFYINSYAQYGIKLEIHVVDMEKAKEMEARKDYSGLPIKEILTETTIVGVPEVLTRVVYAWGYSVGQTIHYTGKLIDLAYVLKFHVMENRPLSEIRELASNCKFLVFKETASDLYNCLRNLGPQARKKAFIQEAELCDLLRLCIKSDCG